MRLFRIFISSLLLLASASLLAQQTPSARPLVERGLNAYLKSGAKAAMEAWLQGSGMEGNTQATSQANTLLQIEDFYGKPESFDIIRENTISPRSHLVVFAVNYSKGVLFGRFQAYRSKAGDWLATEFKFHTEAAALLPNELVYGR